MASAQEWVARNGGAAPTHNYWTDDDLHYNGSPTSCFVDFNGSACPSGQPMRVCTASRNDAEGNVCNWGNCGINAASPNEYFGGCAGNTTAGALCVPSEGCADGHEEQVFANGVVGCAGSVTWDNRDSLCAPGWSAVRGHEWTKSHGSVAPTHAYWTSDNLHYLGSGTNNCSVSLTAGSACPANQPMRVCPTGGTDPEGNRCNWTNCGLDANTPNQYFGGCVGNTTAGTLCAKGDLVTIVQGFQNISTETFTASSGDVLDQCITPGTHRVMRFDFHSKNIGGGEITLGSPPADINAYSPIFVYSHSHGHWHIRNFNVYDLTNTTNPAMSEKGLKQAFCLEDYNEWDPNGEPLRYSCGFQGVSPGWEDIYVSSLPCQFINMDGMGDGKYKFTATTNQSHVVAESDYSNNTTTTYLQISGNSVSVVSGP
jgi:hypothetical protein